MSSHKKGKLKVIIEPEDMCIRPKIIDENGITICHMVADDPQDEAHAKELVRRWNSHDDLLEACKNWLVGLKANLTEREKQLIIQTQAAIAKAEKE